MVTFPYLVVFWPFLESELVQNATYPIFNTRFLKLYQKNMDHPISNATGLMEFGSNLKKIRLFYLRHMFETSYRTSQKPYLPQGIYPKI
jgi:hypothetical protein